MIKTKGRVEKRFASLLAIIATSILSWIFLPRVWFLFLSLPLGYMTFRKLMKKRELSSAKVNLLRQERLFFESLQSNLVGKQNLSQAMLLTQQDLSKLFEEDERIMVALNQYGEIVRLGEGQDKALLYFGHILGDPLMEQFSRSLISAFYQGISIDQLIQSYHLVLVEFQDLADEKEAKLLSSRKEQALLFILPFVMLFMMQITGLDGGPIGLIGLIARSVFLLLFIIAWLWSEQIIGGTGQINVEDFQL